MTARKETIKKTQSPKKAKEAKETIFIDGKEVLSFEEIVLNGVNRIKASFADGTTTIVSLDDASVEIK